MKTVMFYYVRHGQTYLNLQRLIQSTSDSPLTEKGIQDAERAQEALSSVPLNRAYTSSLGRAVQTAEIILRSHPGLFPVLMDDLREFDFGELDGQKIEDNLDEFERRADCDYTDIGGESMPLIAERVNRAFQTILFECEDGDHVLITSHGEFCRQLMEPLLGYPYEEVRKTHTSAFVPNGSIMTFENTDGVWKLIHLPQVPEEFKAEFAPES